MVVVWLVGKMVEVSGSFWTELCENNAFYTGSFRSHPYPVVDDAFVIILLVKYVVIIIIYL